MYKKNQTINLVDYDPKQIPWSDYNKNKYKIRNQYYPIKIKLKFIIMSSHKYI